MVAGTRVLGDFGSAVELGADRVEHTTTHAPAGDGALIAGIDSGCKEVDYFALALTILGNLKLFEIGGRATPDPASLIEVVNEKVKQSSLRQKLAHLLQSVLVGTGTSET